MPTAHRQRRRRIKAEINVVPYVDVMLVLLIIFMVTAPLLHVGVDIKLPQVAAKALHTDDQPVLVSMDKAGNLFLTLGGAPREEIEADALVRKLAAFERVNPGVPVRFAGDSDVPYGQVMHAMVLLQRAGVPNIGLMTQPPHKASRRRHG